MSDNGSYNTHTVTTDEVLSALLGAVIAIGEKLTGERMAVTIRTKAGNVLVHGRNSDVTWLQREADVTPSSDQTERCAKHPELSDVRHATL